MVVMVQGRQNTDSQKYLIALASFAQGIRWKSGPPQVDLPP